MLLPYLAFAYQELPLEATIDTAQSNDGTRILRGYVLGLRKQSSLPTAEHASSVRDEETKHSAANVVSRHIRSMEMVLCVLLENLLSLLAGGRSEWQEKEHCRNRWHQYYDVCRTLGEGEHIARDFV